MKEEISVYFRMVFRDGVARERVIWEEKRNPLSYKSDWRCLARFRAGVGPVPAPKPRQDGSILARWIAVYLRKSGTKQGASMLPQPNGRPRLVRGLSWEPSFSSTVAS
jgi:hypothetical protein